MARDHDAQLAEQLALQQRRAARLDRILDGWPARDQAEELVFLLGGPFGVDWQTGQEPHAAPPPSWEQVVLELGEAVAVAVAVHLEPIWTYDGDGELPWPHEEVMPHQLTKPPPRPTPQQQLSPRRDQPCPRPSA